MPNSKHRPRLGLSALAKLGVKAGFATAKERAYACELPISTMQHLERGSYIPQLEVIDQIAKAFKISSAAVEAAIRASRTSLLKRQLEQTKEDA